MRSVGSRRPDGGAGVHGDARLAATLWCLASTDQAVGRLSSAIMRLDAQALAAATCRSGRTPASHVVEVLAMLEAASAADPDEEPDGHALAASCVVAWNHARARWLEATAADQRALVLVLATLCRAYDDLGPPAP